MRCTAFCTAGSYQLQPLAEFFRSNHYFVQKYRNVLHVVKPFEAFDLFFFHSGCWVSWGLNKEQERTLLQEIEPFCQDALDSIESHTFSYHTDQETQIFTHPQSNMDTITIAEQETANVHLKLAISYGLAQSVKLESYEESSEKVIAANSHIPQELARFGRISLSRKSIFKRIGEIFLEKSSVNLSNGYLDASEYFWRHANLESYYKMTEKFLDINKRVAILNRRLDVLHDIFVILNNQLQHQHSSILESIVILLIMIEILLTVFHQYG